MRLKVENRIEVNFLLCGKRFVLPETEAAWSRLGTLEYTRPELPVDNVNLFEAGWGFREERRNATSLDEVVRATINKVWKHRRKLREFAEKHRLRLILDCYVEYRSDSPLIELRSETIRQMADLQASLGMEVVRLRAY